MLQRTRPIGTTALLGRRSECEALDSLLNAARRGRGGTLVLRGEAGIGKTALLDQLFRRSDGFTVLQAEGSEFETDLAFSALHQLCVSLTPGIPRLPGPQRQALEAALAISGGEPHRFRAALAVLSLLSEAAAVKPLLILVDDAQWLDEESVQALAFVARRIATEPVALVCAVRDPQGARVLAGLPSITLHGLDDFNARALLDSQLRAPLDHRVHDRIVMEARGNPLALLELPRSVAHDRLAGGFAAPDVRPVALAVERDFRERLEHLPCDTRMLMLVAAAEPLGESTLLWQAIERLGIGEDAAAPAHQAGLLAIDTRVRFRHPLVRSAVYRAASAADRRRAHQVLAEVTSAETDPDRRAWHRGQATVRPDEEVAADLHACAERARARGGNAATAAFLVLATQLTPDRVRRAERRLAAARAKYVIGSSDTALDLLKGIYVPEGQPQLSARAATLRAQIAFDAHHDDASVRLLLRAAEGNALHDPERAAHAFLETFAAATLVGRHGPDRRMTDIAAAASAVTTGRHGQGPLWPLLQGTILRVQRGHCAAAPLLHHAVRAYGHATELRDDTGWLLLLSSAAMDLFDDEGWPAMIDRHITLARQAGSLSTLQLGLRYKALVHLHRGALDRAAACCDEAAVITEMLGSAPQAGSHLSLAAWQGREETLTKVLDPRLARAQQHHEGRLETITHMSRAVLLNGIGRHEEALHAALRAAEHDEPGFFSWIAPELVEAAVRSSRPDLAEPVVEQVLERSRVAGTSWAEGTYLRCAALMAPGEDADALFEKAVVCLENSAARVHLARTLLLHGEWLRTRDHEARARARLRMAHEMLTAMGAQAFAQRAEAGLLALGHRPRSRTASAVDRLTTQERQVARLIARGLTSREAAAELFVSPRTVDAHLRSIFRKLELTSRKQLRDAPGLTLEDPGPEIV